MEKLRIKKITFDCNQNYKNNKFINKLETDIYKRRISIYSEKYTYCCTFILKVNSMKRYVT